MITTFNVDFDQGTGSGFYITTAIEQDNSGLFVNGTYALGTQTQLQPIVKQERQVTYVTPNTPFTGYNGGGMTYLPKYIVMVQTGGQPPLRLDMGTIDNQPTWTNDLTGMNTCVADILARFP